MSDARGDQPYLLTTSPPSRDQWRLAVCVLVVLFGALLITAPFARAPLSNTETLLPAYSAALLINELITAALLMALFAVQRSRRVLILAIGYLFSGLLVVPWTLTFPGVFESLGLPDAGIQSTATIATLRRLGFPLFVLAFALMKDFEPADRVSNASVARIIFGSIIGVIAISFSLTWIIITSDDALPNFMKDTRNVSAVWQFVPATAVCLYVAGLIILWIRRRSVLDLWLMVVLCVLLIETFLLSYLSSGLRLSVGWWAGRLFGLVSASVVLVVLLSETMMLYVRLARSILSERRARESRLTVMEAFSATIAHEVSQPLASIVTNADAGLRWLGRKHPDLEETRAALQRIVSDGHRADKVIKGIRAMFRKGAQERAPLNMNQIIEEVLERNQREAQMGRVSVHAEIDTPLPLVTGNPVQIQEVVANLVENAFDAMKSVSNRARVLRIRCDRQESGGIIVAVEDSGNGLEPESKDRIFEPFFSTKSDGMGMGLMFCQAIIEAHGGTLWATDNAPQGAIFQFTLPDDEDGASSTERRTK